MSLCPQQQAQGEERSNFAMEYQARAGRKNLIRINLSINICIFPCLSSLAKTNTMWVHIVSPDCYQNHWESHSQSSRFLHSIFSPFHSTSQFFPITTAPSCNANKPLARWRLAILLSLIFFNSLWYCLQVASPWGN